MLNSIQSVTCTSPLYHCFSKWACQNIFASVCDIVTSRCHIMIDSLIWLTADVFSPLLAATPSPFQPRPLSGLHVCFCVYTWHGTKSYRPVRFHLDEPTESLKSTLRTTALTELAMDFRDSLESIWRHYGPVRVHLLPFVHAKTRTMEKKHCRVLTSLLSHSSEGLLVA